MILMGDFNFTKQIAKLQTLNDHQTPKFVIQENDTSLKLFKFDLKIVENYPELINLM